MNEYNLVTRFHKELRILVKNIKFRRRNNLYNYRHHYKITCIEKGIINYGMIRLGSYGRLPIESEVLVESY